MISMQHIEYAALGEEIALAGGAAAVEYLRVGAIVQVRPVDWIEHISVYININLHRLHAPLSLFHPAVRLCRLMPPCLPSANSSMPATT